MIGLALILGLTVHRSFWPQLTNARARTLSERQFRELNLIMLGLTPEETNIVKLVERESSQAVMLACASRFAMERHQPEFSWVFASAAREIASRETIGTEEYLELAAGDRENVASIPATYFLAFASTIRKRTVPAEVVPAIRDAAVRLSRDDHVLVACNAALVLAAIRDFRPAAASQECLQRIDEVMTDAACREILRRGIAMLHGRDVDEPFSGGGSADGLRHRFH